MADEARFKEYLKDLLKFDDYYLRRVLMIRNATYPKSNSQVDLNRISSGFQPWYWVWMLQKYQHYL